MKPLANYIWVCKHPHAVEPIPSAAFGCFQKNAKRYADIPFHLWVESDRVFNCYAIPPNVTIRYIDMLQMRELPDLAHLDNFEARIDILRLLVLQKTLTEEPTATAVYADFDIPDLYLRSRELVSRIDAYGAAFAGSYIPASIKLVTPRLLFPNKIERINYGKILKSEFENGFIAFNHRGAPLLAAILAQAAADLSHPPPASDPRDLIYFAMARAIDQWARRTPQSNHDKPFPTNWRALVASYYVQYCAGWQIDDDRTLIADMVSADSALLHRLKQWVTSIVKRIPPKTAREGHVSRERTREPEGRRLG
jgi:hypothetical protein